MAVSSKTSVDIIPSRKNPRVSRSTKSAPCTGSIVALSPPRPSAICFSKEGHHARTSPQTEGQDAKRRSAQAVEEHRQSVPEKDGSESEADGGRSPQAGARGRAQARGEGRGRDSPKRAEADKKAREEAERAQKEAAEKLVRRPPKPLVRSRRRPTRRRLLLKAEGAGRRQYRCRRTRLTIPYLRQEKKRRPKKPAKSR
jgi:hypothetical protein